MQNLRNIRLIFKWEIIYNIIIKTLKINQEKLIQDLLKAEIIFVAD